MAAALLAFVLGPVQVQRDGVAVELGGARQRAVLARLLAARGAVVTADRLIEDVWGPEPPPGVVSSLHASVSRLRRALEPDRGKGDRSVLLSRGGGYSLAVHTDVERLAQAVARAGGGYLAHDSSAIVEALRAALDGWQGEPYAELGEQSWLVGERGRCHELRLVALERLAGAHLTAGEPVEASLALLSAFETDPGRERMATLLAVALFRQSRQAEALAVCRRARRVLAEEHGLDPTADLRQVESAILGQDEDLMPSTIPPIPAAEPAQRLGEATPDGVGPASAVGGRLSPAADLSVLVGREHELAVVGAAMSLVVSGQPRIVVLTGEAGIGKTSLAQAVAGDLSERGWIVCWGRCSGSGGAPALWPWLQVLRGLAAVRRLPVCLRSLVDGESVTPADVQAARWRQQRDIAEYLHEVSRAAPLLVIVDDLQWADAASQQVLCGLAESLAGSPVALLVTSRSDAGAESVMVLARLARAGSVRLAMEGLRAGDVERLSRRAGLETDAVALTERTGGNPFLLRETLALAASIGQSPLDVVAATVEDVLRARVALLPTSTGALLSVASVLGRSVDVRVLARLEGAEIGQVETELDVAAGAGLLVPAGSGRMRFVHDLVRETLYHGLSPLRRARLHAHALEVLEAAGRSGPVELAAHAAAAGPDAAPAAVRYAVAAAGEAQARSAYASAVRWWREAVDAEAVRSREPSGRVELLLELVRAQLDAGDAVGALETRSAAIHAAGASHPGSHLRSRRVHGHGGCRWRRRRVVRGATCRFRTYR